MQEHFSICISNKFLFSLVEELQSEKYKCYDVVCQVQAHVVNYPTPVPKEIVIGCRKINYKYIFKMLYSQAIKRVNYPTPPEKKKNPYCFILLDDAPSILMV